MAKLSPVFSERMVKVLAKDETINLKHPIQRKANQWDLETKSKFIHSILYGYPIRELVSIDENGNLYNILDGVQRLTSTFDFINEIYALHANTEDIGDQKIAGLTFSQLPEEMQDEIKTFKFKFHIYKNLTPKEIEELFLRLNAGKPLNKIQLTRVYAGEELRIFIQEIGCISFFANSIAIADSQRNKSIDEELILQVIALTVTGEPMDLGGESIKEFAIKTRKEGLTEENAEIIRQTAQYLSKAFPERYSELKKACVPVLFQVTIQAQKDNISASKFGGLFQQFFTTRKKKHITADAYGISLSGGTAKKEKVAQRLDALMDEYQNNKDSASDYKAKVQKVDTEQQQDIKEDVQSILNIFKKDNVEETQSEIQPQIETQEVQMELDLEETQGKTQIVESDITNDSVGLRVSKVA